MKPKLLLLLIAGEEREKINEWVACLMAGEVDAARDVLQTLRYQEYLEDGLKAPYCLTEKVRTMNGKVGKNMKSKIKRVGGNLENLVRYTVDQLADDYHAGRFTAEYMAEVMGFKDVEELFFEDGGAKCRTIVDFGCGDGDMLKELVGVKRRMERVSGLVNRLNRLFNKAGVINELPKGQQLEFLEGKMLALFLTAGMHMKRALEPRDPHLIGLDQSKICVLRLQDPTIGLTAAQANICDKRLCDKLERKGIIKKGKAGVVTTTLTLDRVPEVGRLFDNIFELLEENGCFMIATKGIIDPRSDGEGGKDPIEYADKNPLKADTPSGTVEKLLAMLADHGLKMERVSAHPYKVSCTDGSQDYDLLVVAGRKMTPAEREEHNRKTSK